MEDFITRNKVILLHRKAFISHGILPNKSVSQDIADSWKRSQKANVSSDACVLPSIYKDYSEMDAAIKQGKTDAMNWASNYKSLQDYNDIILDMGVSVLYINDSRRVFFQRGPHLFLNLLNSRNIGLGTNFDEAKIGTNAVALAMRNRSSSLVIGAEHYIAAFQGLACFAYYIHGDYELLRCVLYLVPIEKMNLALIKLIRVFADAVEMSLQLASYRAKYLIKSQFGQNFEKKFNQKCGVLHVEKHGLVIDANQYMLQILQTSKPHVLGSSLKEVCPQLLPLLDCLKTNKPITSQKVTIEKALYSRTYYADCTPHYEKDELIGVYITLYANKKSNYDPLVISTLKAKFFFDDIIGNSQVMHDTKKRAEKASRTNCTMLLTGESGTGKELFAQSIHHASRRANGPYVSINCAAIPQTLMESEFFGYVEGAFTGARKSGSPGKFELADKGTLFLDEIGEMPLEIQSALLRVLENREITRLGAHGPIPLDVRFIFATNKNLMEEVEEKRFRLDLYYRINVINIDIPPLKDREEDIILLANHYLRIVRSENDCIADCFEPEVLRIFQDYNWPGNVRQLKNIIESSAVQSDNSVIRLVDLPNEIIYNNSHDCLTVCDNRVNNMNHEKSDLSQVQVDMRRKILVLLQRYEGNKSKVAKELGISRATLYKRLQALRLD